MANITWYSPRINYGRCYLVLSLLAKDILAPAFNIATLAQLKVLLMIIVMQKL